MLSGKVRYCDVCNQEIPKGTKYRKVTMRREAAVMLGAKDDSDLIPSWTTNADGMITMDICLTCDISMGDEDEGTPS